MSASGIVARPLRPAQREAALAHLARDRRANLLLLDLVARLGAAAPPGETRPEIVGAWRGSEIVSLASLRPSIVLETGVAPEVLEAWLPWFESLGVGLVKSATPVVDQLWAHLARRWQRRVLVDRIETAYAVRPDEMAWVEAPAGARMRPAQAQDFEALVVAARESLREEQRPDPFAGDAAGFREWVRGRVGRARVVDADGRVVFVGYADVRRDEGWLIQGVYTWPDLRRHGFAAAGVAGLCREAFEAGAEHVQLAVVDGNRAGERLYERLGFKPFVKLRTILFAE